MPIGRYSVRFLRDVMRPKWEAGSAGYEEITIPSFCLADGGRADKGCKLHAFSRGRSVDGRHVIYKPDWGCLEFLAARTFRNGTNEIWHPVKRRRCVAAASSALSCFLSAIFSPSCPGGPAADFVLCVPLFRAGCHVSQAPNDGILRQRHGSCSCRTGITAERRSGLTPTGLLSAQGEYARVGAPGM